MEAASIERKRRVKKDAIEIERYNSVIARNVLFFRTERGWSQDDLESLSGLDKSIISRIENAKYGRRVNDDFVEILARTFKVKSDAITETNGEIDAKLKRLADVSNRWPISDQTIELAEEMLELTRDRGPKERAVAFMNRAHIEYRFWRISRSLDFYEEAYRLALAADDTLLVIKSKLNLSLALIACGRFDKAKDLLSKARKTTNDQEAQARILQAFGSLYIKVGHYDKAEAALKSAISIMPNIAAKAHFHAKCLQVLSHTYTKLEMYDEAIKTANDAINIATDNGDLLTLIHGLKNKSDVLWEQNDIQHSLEILNDAEIEAEKFGRKYEKLMVQFHSAFRKGDYSKLRYVMGGLTTEELPPDEQIDQFEKASALAQTVGELEDAILYLNRANKMLKNI
ncbi:helix-turn-helix domain-containing protein [Tumebacillus lipolyticus]|uniref:Tetratricopeptide repeat protein n=1 Tax=Tumebacillus lipolyticus TaxID=1280370 RepID=A0ABW5A383_9BACL